MGNMLNAVLNPPRKLDDRELIDFNLTASTSRGKQQFMSDNMAGFSDSTAKNI